MDNPKPGPSAKSKSKLDLGTDLTNKFLSGEMSFAEYSSEWYNVDDEDTDDVDDAVHMSDDDSKESLPSYVSDKIIKRRRGLKLSPALTGLMGEANLRFVRGDKEMAEKMCHEIIKQRPTFPEPYQTLAQIYEDDPEKSLQYSLIAAYLSPSDSNEWLRLAAISRERKDTKQEMICYTHAISADPKNLELHMKRLEAFTTLEEMNHPQKPHHITRVKCYHRIVTCIPASEGETIMKYAKMAVNLYKNSNEVERCLDVLSVAYKKCSSFFTLEDINIFLELLITTKQYQTCIEILVAHVGIEIEAEIETIKNDNEEIEEQTNYLNCTIPDNIPIDLKSKLLVCFTHLGAYNLLPTLLNDFLTNDVEKAGDLYMDIEEALSAVGYHDLALRLLEPLVANTSFDLGAVWLKHAECLYNLGREDDAIHSYYKVLKHVPQHPDARKKLFEILEKKGCIDEALDVLQQDYKYVVSASLLYNQCLILKKYNRLLKYLEVGEVLLSRTFARFRHLAELKIAFRIRGGMELVHNFRSMRGENPFNDDDIHFDEEDTFKFSPANEWEFLLDLLKVADQLKKYCAMQRLTYGGLMSKPLNPYRQNLEFLCLQSCLLNNDYINALRLVRDFSQKHPGPRTWNLLNIVFNAVGEYPHIKFLYRLFLKESNMIKNIFLGNNFLTSGRYLVALKYYLEYHEKCKEPLSALLVAISSLVMAALRTVDKHHNLILQGMCYMFMYRQLRQCDGEANYNIARVYQMLSINNLAIEYYEKVLQGDPITICKHHGVIDLKRESAYNLYLLYKTHSPVMARQYMIKYLVIE